jgi:predicted  nucleic acid-binding Zn-ribbon protein
MAIVYPVFIFKEDCRVAVPATKRVCLACGIKLITEHPKACLELRTSDYDLESCEQCGDLISGRIIL